MKKYYTNPTTEIYALQSTWYLMQSLSSNVELNNSGESADPNGAMAPNRKVF